jgi:hypothetical protein
MINSSDRYLNYCTGEKGYKKGDSSLNSLNKVSCPLFYIPFVKGVVYDIKGKSD